MKVSENEMTVSQKIIEDWGTIVHFCRKNNLNLSTFNQILYGYSKSKPISDLLIKHGYIKHASELSREK